VFSFLFDLKRTAVLLCCAPLFVGAAQEIYRLVEGRFTAADLSRAVPPGLERQLDDAARKAAPLDQQKLTLALLVSVPDRIPETVAPKASDDDLLKLTKRRAAALADLKLLFRCYTDLHELRTERQVKDYTNAALAEGPKQLRDFVEKFKGLVCDELRLRKLAEKAAALDDRDLPAHLKAWDAEIQKHFEKEGANEDFCRVQAALVFKHRFRLQHRPDDFRGVARAELEKEKPDPQFLKDARGAIVALEQKLRDLRGAPDEEEVKDLHGVLRLWLAEWQHAVGLFDLRDRARALAAKPGGEVQALLAELADRAADKKFGTYAPAVLAEAWRFLDRFLPAPLPPEPTVMLRTLDGRDYGPVPRDSLIVYWREMDQFRSVTLKGNAEAQKKFNEFDARLWMSLDRASIDGPILDSQGKPALDEKGKPRLREYQGLLLPTPRAAAHHDYNQIRTASGWRWGKAALARLAEALEARGPQPGRTLRQEMDPQLWERIVWLQKHLPEALGQQAP
jgi:hypothetical protein